MLRGLAGSSFLVGIMILKEADDAWGKAIPWPSRQRSRTILNDHVHNSTMQAILREPRASLQPQTLYAQVWQSFFFALLAAARSARSFADRRGCVRSALCCAYSILVLRFW